MTYRGASFAGLFLIFSLSGLPLSALAALLPAEEGLSADKIAHRSENNLRSDRTVMEARMVVISPRITRPREMEFTSWEDREGKRSFVRMEAPSKDKGTGFLKLHPNLWMYIPRVERTMRIPPSMMLQSWMGSDFTNDDLVRDSSETDDYDHQLLGIETEVDAHPGREAYLLEYIPKEEAPVVWGKILAWIDVERGVVLRQEFYDEDGEKLRTMQFEDIREVDGRWLPHVWKMTPENKKGHQTTIEIKRMDFDAEIEDDIFTKRNLRKGTR